MLVPVFVPVPVEALCLYLYTFLMLSFLVQEDPEVYNRHVPETVEPDNIEDEYEEVPSPLPSPRDESAD